MEDYTMQSKLTLRPCARSHRGRISETDPITQYRVEFDPPLPGYSASISCVSAIDHAPRWRTCLTTDDAQRDYPRGYQGADEALTVLQKEFEN